MITVPAQPTPEAIVTAYQQSGNRLGWRFLYSPAHVLEGSAVALIGLNPGGRDEDPTHARFAMTSGSAYVTESWHGYPIGASPLQQQVRLLFGKLGVEPEDVLAGNIIPFRSPSKSALINASASLAFGREVWKAVIEKSSPELIVAMGKDAEGAIARTFNLELVREEMVGWGSYAGRAYDWHHGRVVALPHLSRFTIMNRPQSQAALQNLFGSYWVGRT
jgi:hypothetical protein